MNRSSVMVAVIALLSTGCEQRAFLPAEPCAAEAAHCSDESTLGVCLDGQRATIACSAQCPAGALASCGERDGVARCECREAPRCDVETCPRPLACLEDGRCACAAPSAVCTSATELDSCPHREAEVASVDCAGECAREGLVGRCVAEPTATCRCEPRDRPIACGARACGASPDDPSREDACGACVDGLVCTAGRCLPLAPDPRVGCCLDHREVTFARSAGAPTIVACGPETSCGWDPGLAAYGCVPAPGGPDPSGAHPQFCPAPWSRPPCQGLPSGGYCASLALECGSDGCGGSCGDCAGRCEQGRCVEGTPTPGPEVCNGIDDDLDGTTDLSGLAPVCGDFALCGDGTCLCVTAWSDGWPSGWEPCRAPGACVPDGSDDATSTCSEPPVHDRHCAPGPSPGLSSVWRMDEAGRLLEVEPCGPCACVDAACVRQAASELCDDGVDNDCDGLTDTLDANCSTDPHDDGASP